MPNNTSRTLHILRKSTRLSREELEIVMKTGSRIHGRLFSFVFKKTGRSACAVVISKKVAKTAVARNTIRRRVRAILTHEPASVTLVCIAKAPAATASFDEIRDDIRRFLLRTV